MIRRVSRTHHIPLDRRTLHGHFSRDLAAVITVDPGDSVEFQALDAGWHWELDWRVARSPRTGAGRRAPPGRPIEVRGARAGQTLVVRIDEVRPRDWGITFAGEDSVVWRLGADTGTTADGDATVALAPFLGVIGMPPAEPGVHSTTPPRRQGGNIDCKELTAGATLLLADRGRRSTGVGRRRPCGAGRR